MSARDARSSGCRDRAVQRVGQFITAACAASRPTGRHERARSSKRGPALLNDDERQQLRSFGLGSTAIQRSAQHLSSRSAAQGDLSDVKGILGLSNSKPTIPSPQKKPSEEAVALSDERRLAEEVATLRQAVRPARDALDAAQKSVDDAAAKQESAKADRAKIDAKIADARPELAEAEATLSADVVDDASSDSAAQEALRALNKTELIEVASLSKPPPRASQPLARAGAAPGGRRADRARTRSRGARRRAAVVGAPADDDEDRLHPTRAPDPAGDARDAPAAPLRARRAVAHRRIAAAQAGGGGGGGAQAAAVGVAPRRRARRRRRARPPALARGLAARREGGGRFGAARPAAVVVGGGRGGGAGGGAEDGGGGAAGADGGGGELRVGGVRRALPLGVGR